MEARQRARLRLRRAVVALLAGIGPLWLAQPALAETECIPVTVETRRIGGRKVERIYGEPTTVEFVAGMKIDADGALRAYHPDEAPGLDQLEHAGAPGNWWGIVTDDGTPGGRRASRIPTGNSPIRSATSMRPRCRTWRCNRCS